MPGTNRQARSDARKLADRVREAVDGGADAAEEIHKRVVNLPLDVLERNGVLESTAKDLRRFQDQAIGALYDLVRGVNHDVVKLAKDVLRPPPAPRPRARKHPARKRVKKTAAA